jgi:glycosyltransferase 2 family protein
MLKTFFLNSIKFLIAGSLIYWLVNSGKLDFKLIANLANSPLALITAAFLSILNFWLISIRWREILKARSDVHIPTTGLLKVTWIGQFFSSVLPGSVSGDLVKMLYVQEYNPKFSKKFLLVSILLDRVMGLCGLILLVGLSSLFFSNYLLETSPGLKPLLLTNYLLSSCVIFGLFLYFFFDKKVRILLIKLSSVFLKNFWEKIIQLWDDLSLIKSRLIRTVLVSIVVQFIGVVIFWSLISEQVAGKMDFIQALAFIPLGLMTLALPIAPSGLGVGHAIFQKLFQLCQIENGASLFNIYFFATLMINLLGSIPYLLNRPKKKIN